MLPIVTILMYALDPYSPGWIALDPLPVFSITRCITLFDSRWYNNTFLAWSLNYTIVVRGPPAETGGREGRKGGT